MAFLGPQVRLQLRSIGGAVFLALCIRCFIGEIFQIPSGSMIPTLEVGDRIFVNKLAYGPRVPFTAKRLWAWGRPSRGEVVVFISPFPPHTDFIKRIVAVAGDQVEVRDGQVYVNDERLVRQIGAAHVYRDCEESTQIWRDLVAVQACELNDAYAYTVIADVGMAAGQRDMAPKVIPAGEVFVMGDNRFHSSDSRQWGNVPEGALLGRAVRRFFSWGEHGLSWRRIGGPVNFARANCPASQAPLASDP